MYEHDVFLSYARRNNVAGWVTEFRNALENALREKPEVQNVNIFMDEKDIAGGDAFDQRIGSSLAKSAALVIIVSDALLDADREWCHRERREFIRHAGGEQNVAGRIYLVNYDGIDPAKLPEEIRRFTPYTFFERDRKTDDVRPGALFEQGAGRFHTELYNLRRDLIEAFHRLEAPSIRREVKPEVKVAPVSTNNGTSSDVGPTVFLGEVIPGKIEQARYAQLESALLQRVAVVPGRRSYFSAHDGFAAEIDELLQQSNLFVQLLSTQRWPTSPNFEQGYERWLYERAKTLNVPILRWRSSDMDVRSVDDQNYLDFLNLDEPRICDLSEFIPLVFDELEKQQTRRKFNAGTETYPVLLMADSRDEELCDDVGAIIEDMGAGGGVEPELLLVSDEGQIDVVSDADSLSPVGLVVVWDQGSEVRLRSLLKQCRRYRRTREIDPPECAIVVPSEETHVVNRRPPRFQVIGSDDQDELKEYLDRLCGEVA